MGDVDLRGRGPSVPPPLLDQDMRSLPPVPAPHPVPPPQHHGQDTYVYILSYILYWILKYTFFLSASAASSEWTKSLGY